MIAGFGIGNYRSIGEMMRISPLGQINLFVGPNNCGKSNILRFVNENLARLQKAIAAGGNVANGLTQYPHLSRGGNTTGELAVKISEEALRKHLLNGSTSLDAYIKILASKLSNDGLLWLDSTWPSETLRAEARNWLDWDHWYHLWSRGTSISGGDLDQDWIPETLRRVRQLATALPSVYTIPIDRRADSETIDPKEHNATLLSGKGVIRTLAAMQNPSHTSYDADRQRFVKIEEFVRVVTDDETATISVTHRQDEILVKLKGQAFLPLAALGSGIEQVVLHAIAATAATDSIVTFEEPELHLHPVLQRQLLRYLTTTSNQYFISTHSAHLIDTLHAATFHVRLVEGQTTIEKASTDAARYRVCEELGYRPSDIVQANCVIWVEGPSDRIYLRKWLDQVDAHLQEHVHYSIMFYAGKLLSQLSADATDPAEGGLEDLIQLRDLNRQFVVIMDSDINAEGEPIRQTKQRVKKEIETHGGIAWVTQGRETENYVPHDILARAVEQVKPGRGKAVRKGQFVKTLPTENGGKSKVVDKVKVASQATQVELSLDILDLRQRIKEIATFVRKANGLPIST